MSGSTTSNRSASPNQLSKNFTHAQNGSAPSHAVQKSHQIAGAKPKHKLMFSAQFNHRVMINFKMSSRTLATQLPAGLELLPFRSSYYVTFMATHIRGVKMFGLPIFPAFNAISLRTYVRSAKFPSTSGNFTFGRYVSSSAGAWLLKKKLGLTARVIPIKRNVKSAKGAPLPSVRYGWKTGDAEDLLRITARSQVRGDSDETKPGWMLNQLNEFTVVKNKIVVHKTVNPKCKAYDVAKANFKCSVKKMFGQTFVKSLQSRPASVYLFDGGKTTFMAGEAL